MLLIGWIKTRGKVKVSEKPMLYGKLTYMVISFLIMYSVFGYSQTVIIKGSIIDKQQIPIEGAAVVLYNIDRKILNYSTTNQFGVYEIESVVKDNYFLEITHISFIKKKIHFLNKDILNGSFTGDFILEENTASLDEVIVISSDKVKDTVKLDLKKLKLQEDDNLRDILNKIPNFRLSDKGTIIYKGKNIDKILVNNKPSFVNQNSIALESIENKIIKSISVINNYFDNFSLDFDENKETVLNIDTKNKGHRIINGSIQVGYGYRDKYEFKGKGFLFSKNLNAFLTNNTNNIGRTKITLREIKRLFRDGQPFSPYQEGTLGTLFATNENLKRDDFTSTNLTLRNQTQKLKTSGLFYFISPKRLSSIIENINTLENSTPLLNTLKETQTKMSSFLSSTSIAYKISNKAIAKYNLSFNYIDSKNRSDLRNRLYVNGNESNSNTIFARNLNKIVSSFHQFSLTNKLILVTRLGYYIEDAKLLNNYTIKQNVETIFNEQNFRFTKNKILGNIGLKYKFSDAFIPLLSIKYNNTLEKIRDKSISEIVVEREQNSYQFDLQIRGKRIIKNVDYKLDISLQTRSNKLVPNTTDNSIFFPINAILDYENKLNRYYLNYSRSRKLNDLVSGISIIEPFNSIVNGDGLFPLNYTTSSNFYGGYSYDNLFDAELFSISVLYSAQNHALRRNYLYQQDGISQYRLFRAENAVTFGIASFYSKIIFPLKYPTKIDVGLTYNQTRFPSKLSQQKIIDIISGKTSPEFKIETVTDNLVNFRFSSNMSFVNDKVLEKIYKATYASNVFSILLKNKQWRGNISFLYDNSYINRIRYTRKNINADISYARNKIVFSLKTRHLGELLSFFQNTSYNSQFTVSNGITSTIINNQSLNYIIFGIKFKL